MRRPVREFELLSFDCYGTLIDWETGIWDALQPLLMQSRCARVIRSQALQRFALHENRIERERPHREYPAILSRVHNALAGDFGLQTTPELDAAFGGSVPGWPAFADTAESLRILQARYRLVILSNIDRVSFTASSRKLGVTFDAVYTAQDIGSYKPAAANFEYLKKQVHEDFGIGQGAILHTAQSLYHDHVPARACGLANAWIDRQRLSEGGDWGATAAVADRPEVDYRFHSMAEFAAAVQQESA
jgi:2-haloacid dehalogenase